MADRRRQGSNALLWADDHKYQHLNYYFWQDHQGLEIDLLPKTAEGFDLYEVKSTQTLNATLFKNLNHFGALVEPRPVRPHLVYGGDQAMVRNKVRVMSWKMSDQLK